MTGAVRLVSDTHITADGDWGKRISDADSTRLDHILSASNQETGIMRLWSDCYRLLLPTKRSGMVNPHDPTLRYMKPSSLNITRSGESDGNPPDIDAATAEAIKRFDEAVRYCYQRKIFITQSGLLGIGPRTLQDGDVITVSKLSQWPMVLHRDEELGPDHYTMIGAAFVEGISSGEDVFVAAAEGKGIGIIHLV